MLFLVPSILCDESIELDDVGFKKTICFYSDDIPGTHLIFQELNLWKHRWSNIKTDERPQNLAETFLAIDEITFPNLLVVLQIAATLPVTRLRCGDRYIPETSSLEIRLYRFTSLIRVSTGLRKFVQLYLPSSNSRKSNCLYF